MAATFVLSQFHLANHRAYRDQVLGMNVRYTTPEGNVVDGVLSEHPMHPGGLQLAVVAADGRWAAVHSGETLEVR
jgi:hypothetical protein